MLEGRSFAKRSRRSSRTGFTELMHDAIAFCGNREKGDQMNADFVEDAAMELFGENLKSKLPAAMGRDESTLRRQGYRNAIPGPVKAAVAAWLILGRKFWVLPPYSPKRHSPP